MKSFMKSRIELAPAARAGIARAIVAVAFAGLFTAACDDGISGPGGLSTLAISSDAQSVAVRGTLQFTVVGSDVSGADVSITPVWSVVGGGGTISSSGMFTAGTTAATYAGTVKATSGSYSSTATVIVTAGPLATIEVSANPNSMVVASTWQFTAAGMDADSNSVVIDPTWSVVGSGGTIDTTGEFTAGGETGTYTDAVRASVGEVAGFATVTVSPGPLASLAVAPNPLMISPEGTYDFSVVGKDAGGNVHSISPPVWSIVNGGGSIDAETGLFTAGTLSGTFVNTVMVTSDSISGFATVSVAELEPPIDPIMCPPFCPWMIPVLTSIVVSPNSVVMLPNSTHQFTATGYDQFGHIFPVSVSWSVEHDGGMIDTATGLFTAGPVWGTFSSTVVASGGGRQGLASVTVTGCGDVDLLDSTMLFGCASAWSDAAMPNR